MVGNHRCSTGFSELLVKSDKNHSERDICTRQRQGNKSRHKKQELFRLLLSYMCYLCDLHMVNCENYMYILKIYKDIFTVQKKFLSLLLLRALELRRDMSLFHNSFRYKDYFPCW